MRRYTVLISIFLLLALIGPGHAERASEQQVKAAYLYHFIQFVDWEATHSGLQQGPLQLCLIGGDPFGESLAEVMTRSIRGRALRILIRKDFSAIDACHVLYVNSRLGEAFDAYLDRSDRPPALTVSDMAGFAQRGGMIGLVTVDDRVRLEINQQSVRQAGLRLSAKLFEVALRVYPHDAREVVP